MATTTGFKVKLFLNEDVEAELEDFMIFSRLGMNKESYYMIENVLHQHLVHFVVVEEIIQFLLDQRDWDTLTNLLQKALPDSRYWDDEQKSLVHIMLLKSRKDSYPHEVFNVPIFPTSVDVAQLTTTGLLIQEVRFQDCHHPSSNDAWMAYYEKLKGADLAWEAVRFFGSLASSKLYELQEHESTGIGDIYQKLVQWLHDSEGGAGTQSQTRVDQQICLIRAHYAYLRYLFGDNLEWIVLEPPVHGVEKASDYILKTVDSLTKRMTGQTSHGAIHKYCEEVKNYSAAERWTYNLEYYANFGEVQRPRVFLYTI